MNPYEKPLEEVPVRKPIRDVRMTKAANDSKFFPREIIVMGDGTQRLQDRSPEALIAIEAHHRDDYWAMVGVYEALKEIENEDTAYGKEYRTKRKMVVEGKMDKTELVFPPEWESRLEALTAKALKISLNVHSSHSGMKGGFKNAFENGTIEDEITRYTEEAVKAETNIARYQEALKVKQAAPPRYEGEDNEATTVLYGNGQE